MKPLISSYHVSFRAHIPSNKYSRYTLDCLVWFYGRGIGIFLQGPLYVICDARSRVAKLKAKRHLSPVCSLSQMEIMQMRNERGLKRNFGQAIEPILRPNVSMNDGAASCNFDVATSRTPSRKLPALHQPVHGGALEEQPPTPTSRILLQSELPKQHIVLEPLKQQVTPDHSVLTTPSASKLLSKARTLSPIQNKNYQTMRPPVGVEFPSAAMSVPRIASASTRSVDDISQGTRTAYLLVETRRKSLP